MKKIQGFALLEALLALVLMMIAAGASYTLIKSFRANSSIQQFIRYSTNITQSFMPFVDGGAYSTVLSGNKLSQPFLTSISIPSEDQRDCSNAYCYVSSGMYLDGGSAESNLSFGVQMDSAQELASYFMIAVNATGLQVNQILQTASTMFSVYCAESQGANISSITTPCVLQSSANNSTPYSLFLVFPKSGDAPPVGANLTPPS
ncbi:MAG: prepilin-type N-terminal cleavage/methylation domain-containing protein [Gammaproteobacteria bacterium]|nr:prepilin-type N-terminal cleavage/methylation domain-containing protein [Gammaproteobacteria bacterium]MCD8542129.1 prepilin-type N-terminal cleavage/methylation domain-containing protein [Gammaproteobacteria bacterium]